MRLPTRLPALGKLYVLILFPSLALCKLYVLILFPSVALCKLYVLILFSSRSPRLLLLRMLFVLFFRSSSSPTLCKLYELIGGSTAEKLEGSVFLSGDAGGNRRFYCDH